ncbi:MAG: sensor histidine kinase [Chloroflexi bacterium]|nr:sensor histidine kinase [Chloroflexota bacterium]
MILKLTWTASFVYSGINMKQQFLMSSRQPYERSIYLFLGAFRFFTFALAMALIFIIPKQLLDWGTILLIAFIGLYTALRILFHFPIWQRYSLAYSMLGIDLVVCLIAVLLTRGADSPFLLYALLPTTTAALLFDKRVTTGIAFSTALTVVMAHAVLPGFNPNYGFILQGDYLTRVLLYVIALFGLATIAYQTNMNIYQRIQSNSIVEERKRLRQEIHDSTAQVLSYLSTKIELLKRSLPASEMKLQAELDEIQQVAVESYQDIREAIDALRAETGDVSLAEALSGSVERTGKRANYQTEFVAPPEMPPVSPGVQLQLLRIAQEALNNARKHAGATQIRVRLDATPQTLEMVVKDNGRGFSLSETREGAGLGIMRERAKSVNGNLEIVSSPGQGTEVRVKVPRR